MRKIYHSAKGKRFILFSFLKKFLFLYFQKLHLLLEFRELYFQRWGVETFYDEIKNRFFIKVCG
jgi:hypothetical protein